MPEPILPHAYFGNANCTGCLQSQTKGDEARIICTTCGEVLRSMPASQLQRSLDEMELSLDVASEQCPHCRSINLFPGFSRMQSFVCQQCGKAVTPT